MDQRVPQLEGEIRRLSRALEAVERRVATLEATLVAVSRGLPGALSPAPGATPGPERSAPSGVEQDKAIGAGESTLLGRGGAQASLALAGRTLMVLGGAYLLRALTEANVLPAAAGVSLGLLYAAVWLAAAARARDRASTTYHALAASLITLPIVWEATFRFALLSPAASAATLSLFAGAGLLVSVARRHEAAAWIVAASVCVCSVALAIATRGFIPHTVLVVAIGIATLWLGYVYDWLLLRWPVAMIATAMVGGVTLRGAAGIEPLAAFLVQLFFFGSYLGSFAVRTLFLGRAVIPFEVFQSIAVIAVGFGGAVYLSSATGAAVRVLGLVALGFGTAGYAVAFAFVERRCPARNFFFYAAVALTYLLVGAPMVLGAGGASIVFAALGAAAAIAASRIPRVTLTLHCALYLVAAAIASGLLALSFSALASTGPLRTGVTLVQALTLVAIAVAVTQPVQGTVAAETGHRLPRRLLFALFVWTGAGAAVALVVTAAAGVDAAWMAAIRTLVLVAAVLLVSREARGSEGGWLLYPLLALLALKLVIDDLPHGRPATLTVGLAAYGAALLVAPRLWQNSRGAS